MTNKNRFKDVSKTYWAKSALAGATGGAVLGLLLSMASAMQEAGFWYPLNAIGSRIFGGVPDGGFSGLSLEGAAVDLIHGALWGLILGALVVAIGVRVLPTWRRAALASLGWGLVFYLIAGFVTLPGADAIRGVLHPVAFGLVHIVSGAAMALALYAWTKREELRVTFAPEIEIPVHHRSKIEW